MKYLIYTFILLFSYKASAQNCMEVVGYYPNWQWYDRNKLVNPQTIDYSKYTILNYAFLNPQSDGSIALFDAWADENLLLGQPDWNNGGYIPNTSLIAIAHAHNVKVLPSIGGWTLSDNFPGIAADAQKRATFTQACIELIDTYDFDGIDLDWEYPGFAAHGGSPADFNNFTLLLQDLRSALDLHSGITGKAYLLTAAVGASETNMSNVDWNQVAPLLDIINLMSYDFFGTWDAITNHNAPLEASAQGDPEFNLRSTVNRLVNDRGVDPQKITVGMAFYGRSAITNGAPGLHVPSTGVADNTIFALDDGTPLYYNILLNQSQFTEHWDATAKVPYMLGTNSNTFLSYDNEQSIELKSQMVVEENLRGAIIWEITGDYLETSPGSGIIAGTPLVDKINAVFCNYVPGGGGGSGNVGIDDLALTALQIFPNPAQNSLTIQAPETIAFVTVFDALGRKVLETSQQETLDLTFLMRGVYRLEVNYENGQHDSAPFVKY